MKKRKWKIRFRPLSYIFRKDWYYNRLKLINEDKCFYDEYEILMDIGFITIVKYKEKKNV
jgi:hypothetical protein